VLSVTAPLAATERVGTTLNAAIPGASTIEPAPIPPRAP